MSESGITVRGSVSSTGTVTVNGAINGTAVTQSATDTTWGRLLKVGDYGLGNVAVALADLNDAAGLAAINITDTTINRAESWGVVINAGSGGHRLQLQKGNAGDKLFFRGTASAGGGTWPTPWRELYHTGNTGTAVTADVTTSMTDTTAGRLLKVGDFGWGGNGGISLAFDSAQYSGTYFMDNPGGGLPNGRYAVFVSRITPASASGEVIQLAVSTTSRQYVRRRVSGAWQPWVEVYTQNSILGTVSQSGGVPTGAIIERGGNSNGIYIRFADGTQICMVQFSGTTAVTTASGSSFVSFEQGWTFPAAFASDYISVSGCVVGTGACTLRQSTTLTTTALTFKLHSSVSGTFNFPRVFAIGRWF